MLELQGIACVLELQGIACVRGDRSLFSGVDLTLQPGQLLRVTGINGAGKTSLLRLLCGLLTPERGQVRWGGQNIAGLRDEFNRQLVYIGHAAALKDDLSALENLQAACVLGGSVSTDSDALGALGRAGLRGRERVLVRRLSQGQRRRVSLARLALAAAAPLWVLDEPFNALDTAATAWLLALITEQLQRGGMVVLTSHQSVALSDAVHQVTLSL